MKSADALRTLARLCEVFPQARIGGAMLVSRRIAFSGANSVLARCYGPDWVAISGDQAATACALAAAICEARDVPAWRPA